eukprot:TRINITY_DN35227_c0_g1_i1.p1 TRINITY_DN35227_c0_g1~~TRINITY_DN35227_c0_g1_i1.p1  ORF type:complete len:311 (+),score=92.09 TRINITY_DN35227_c0_g1_i1:26-958(+)
MAALLQEAICKVPWPASLIGRAQGLLDDQLQKGDACKVLQNAARQAVESWDELEAGNCEQTLCLIDRLVSSAGATDVTSWPLELQLLVILANTGTEDSDFLLHAAECLELKAATAATPVLQEVMQLGSLLRLRAAWLAAVDGQIQSIEDLHQSIETAVAPRAAAEQDASRKRSRAAPDGEEVGAVSKEALAAVAGAEKALRNFAWHLMEAAFDEASSQAAETPLPCASVVLQAAKPLEASFPEALLCEAIKRISAAVAEASESSVSAAVAEKQTSPRKAARNRTADPKPVIVPRQQRAPGTRPPGLQLQR